MICKLFKKSYFSENFIKMVKDYSQEKRNYINIRYIRIIKNLERSTMISAFYYYLFSTLITYSLLLLVIFSFVIVQIFSKLFIFFGRIILKTFGFENFELWEKIRSFYYHVMNVWRLVRCHSNTGDTNVLAC